MDIIVGGEKLTPTAEKLRRLMHYGRCTSRTRCTSSTGVARSALRVRCRSRHSQRHRCGGQVSELAVQAVMMRKYGQEIIKATQARRSMARAPSPAASTRPEPGRARRPAQGCRSEHGLGQLGGEDRARVHHRPPEGTSALWLVRFQPPVVGARRRRHGSVSRQPARGGRPGQEQSSTRSTIRSTWTSSPRTCAIGRT